MVAIGQEGWKYSYSAADSDMEGSGSRNESSKNDTNGDAESDAQVLSSSSGSGGTGSVRPGDLRVVTDSGVVSSSSVGSPVASGEEASLKSGSSQPLLIQKNRNSVSLAKSAPADPHTTIQDVESVDLKLSPPSTPTNNGYFLDQQQQQQQNGNRFFNMLSAASSLGFSKTPPSKGSESYLDENGVMTVSMGNNVTSPSMMSFRKTSKGHRKTNTSVSSIESPLVEDVGPIFPHGNNAIQEDEFDESQYVDEKFKNTKYRYAIEQRNTDFHQLFKSIPLDERLLDDFSCALSKEILLQGRIYITEKNICFNSKLLTWVTNLVIPFTDIVAFEKTATVGLFPNGIAITTKNDNKYYFASFISRDTTFIFFETIWHVNNNNLDLSKSSTSISNSTSNSVAESDSMNPLISKDISSLENEQYEEALLSIDGDTPRVPRNYNLSDDSEEDSDEYSDETESSSEDKAVESTGTTATTSTTQTVYKLKDGSKYKYDGPWGHGPTKADYDPAANNEIILADEIFNAPPGVIFDILFGSNNEVTVKFLKQQKGEDFSEFEPYRTNEDGHKERKYNYIKGLNYSIGPKSTKCFVTDTIENLDYSKGINVISNTSTPGVPSGDAFTVNTRYLFTWSVGNKTRLIISFWVHWTGSSWVKGIIDKSCRSGQEEATKDLIPILQQAIDENTVPASEQVVSVGTKEEKSEKSLEPSSSTAKAADSGTNTFNQSSKLSAGSVAGTSIFNYIIVLLLTILIILQGLILYKMDKDNREIKNELLISTMDRDVQEVLFKGQELLLWNWIDERTIDKASLSQNEVIDSIKTDIDELVSDWAQGSAEQSKRQPLLKRFQQDLNSYIQHDLSYSETDKSLKERKLKEAIQALLQ